MLMAGPGLDGRQLWPLRLLKDSRASTPSFGPQTVCHGVNSGELKQPRLRSLLTPWTSVHASDFRHRDG